MILKYNNSALRGGECSDGSECSFSGLCCSLEISKIYSRSLPGADPGFFIGEGGGGGWYLWVAESMGHVPKMLQLELNCKLFH